MRKKSVYFFADAHLTCRDTARERERNARLDRFLAHVTDHASELYILGDLFDFWFEWRQAIPRGHLWLYRRLHEIREADIPIVFLSGNHDYWCLPFLAREFGVEVHAGPLGREIDGRKIWMAHGDGLVSGDGAYKVLRSILRNRLCIGAFRLLHPDLAVGLADRSSAGSRLYTQARDVRLDRWLGEVAAPRFEEGYDAVLLGHVHVPTHERIEGGRDFLFVGDWIRSFTYVTLTDGVLALHHFGSGSESVGSSDPGD